MQFQQAIFIGLLFLLSFVLNGIKYILLKAMLFIVMKNSVHTVPCYNYWNAFLSRDTHILMNN